MAPLLVWPAPPGWRWRTTAEATSAALALSEALGELLRFEHRLNRGREGLLTLDTGAEGNSDDARDDGSADTAYMEDVLKEDDTTYMEDMLKDCLLYTSDAADEL